MKLREKPFRGSGIVKGGLAETQTMAYFYHFLLNAPESMLISLTR
jgi:hypothetical protein